MLRGSDIEIKCYRCGEIGHNVTECPHKTSTDALFVGAVCGPTIDNDTKPTVAPKSEMEDAATNNLEIKQYEVPSIQEAAQRIQA